MSNEKHRIVIDIAKEDNENLNRLAKSLGGLSKSDIVRLAIRYHLTRNVKLIEKQKEIEEEENKGEK